MPRTIFDKRNERYKKLHILINGTVSLDKKNPEVLGQALGVSGRTVYRYLKSPEKMSLEHLLKLSRNLNIPIDELRESIRY